MPSKKQPSPLVLSLFCGAGGLDVGFEQKGFDVGLAFDIRADSIESYNHNRPHKRGVTKDITKLTIAELDTLYGSEFKPVGIIGGPPCQGFSISNVNKKSGDIRNTLSFTYAKILKDLNKRSPVHFFVFENVKGLLQAPHKKTYENIKRSFESCGFKIYPMLLNSAHFGVPQVRERLIIIGLNKDIYPNFEIEIQKFNSEDNFITVENAIGALSEPSFFSARNGIISTDNHPNHWCMTPKSKKFFNGSLIPGTSFGRSFKTIRWDRPSPTVAYGNREVHVHPSGKRRLSVYEAMILQGFPKDYVLKGNLSQQIKQVSEAVPPPLASAVANAIVMQLKLHPHS